VLGQEIGKILSLRILGCPIDRLTEYLPMYNFIRYVTEGKAQKLEQIALPYSRDALGRSLSKAAIDYHYGKLYKTYVERYNNREGDVDFNEAGAFLHSIYFAQFCPPKGSNKPTGLSLEFIEKHFKSFDKFKQDIEKTAMAIQGSGWVYLSTTGKIKTIVNHEIRKDILLVIDWWEHAFNIDFGADKKKYLEGQWKIIDWSRINTKLEVGNLTA
jgi:Fe-Mn family superoxide dismutase